MSKYNRIQIVKNRAAQYKEQRLKYILKVQKKFSLHNCFIFFCYMLYLYFFGGRFIDYGACLLICILSGINLLFAHIIKSERTKYILEICYIFLLLTMLFLTNIVCGNNVSWTILLCSIITTAMLGMETFTYVGILLSAVAINEIVYMSFLCENMERMFLYFWDDIVLCVFAIGINATFDDIKRKDWEKEEKLILQSSIDNLTNLYNRRYAEDYYKNRLDENKSYVVLYLDLDNFKKVNDVFGHSCGDEVLIETAQLLKETFEEKGMVARLGGDEFLVITEVLDLWSLLRQIQKFLNKYPIFVKGEIELSTSIGIGLRPVGSKKTYEEICNEADDAMYKAKKLGKARAFLEKNNFTNKTIITAESIIV